MITLITGTPGSGKTAYVVAELLKVTGRPIYVYNVNGLTLPHEPLEDLNEWHTIVPDGALVVADEVQRAWRPAAAGSKVPDSIAELETHRHRGVDFWIISQSPSLVHTNVRKLIGRHIHLVGNWAGRYAYEWSECNTSPDSGRGRAIKTRYTLPKKAFQHYKSAEIHTKLNRKLPPVIWGLGVAVVFVGLLGFRLYGKLNSAIHPQDAEIAASYEVTDGAPSGAPARRLDDGLDFSPRVVGRPETAPVYDHLRRVKDFPRIAGCISSETRGCSCFTQQGTVYPVAVAVCESMLAGAVFDPYREPAREVAPAAARFDSTGQRQDPI